MSQPHVHCTGRLHDDATSSGCGLLRIAVLLYKRLHFVLEIIRNDAHDLPPSVPVLSRDSHGGNCVRHTEGQQLPFRSGAAERTTIHLYIKQPDAGARSALKPSCFSSALGEVDDS